jgi:ribosomal protein S18 acetylase RimI-like enzyme
MWLVLDPRNEDARKFYERLGFKVIDGSVTSVDGGEMGD